MESKILNNVIRKNIKNMLVAVVTTVVISLENMEILHIEIVTSMLYSLKIMDYSRVIICVYQLYIGMQSLI